MDKNYWYEVKNQSLAVYARYAGFDLAIYDQYSEDVRQELRSNAIKEALWEIEEQFEYYHKFRLSEIKNGVYVISLSNPLSIRYEKHPSQVIYIGMGNIRIRIEEHFKNSLFDFMQSLSGANFDFYFAQPSITGPKKDYHKHIEYLMLAYFSERFGGIKGKTRFPVLNKNAGSDKGFDAGTEWWKKPLRFYKKGVIWALNPTEYLHFRPLDEDE